MYTTSSLDIIVDYLEPYLPYMVTGFLFTAITFIGILTYFVRTYLKKSPTGPASSFSAQPGPKKEDLVLKSSKITEFFSLFGYFPITPLARSFLQAMRILRTSLGGRRYKYSLPWFALIGAENSGKTSFIENAALPLPLGMPLIPQEGEKPGCSWFFFEHGVVLDVDGSYLIQEKTTLSNNLAWYRFFNLLSHFRVERPLDGIILTIPVTELFGETAYDTDTLLERSEAIYEKLTLIEKKLGLNIPMYVVVTKCDIIPGFKSFTAALPDDKKSQMFGWSSPYDPLENFQGEWVNEAFEEIISSLTLNQLEIFTQNIEDNLKDGIMLFPRNFHSLQQKLQLYLTNIFKNVGYREAFFCRGIYFTGDTSWQPQDALQGMAQNPRGHQPLESYNLENARKIVFVTQLLEDKVFPEYTLAAPGPRRLIASSRAINITRLLMVFTFILLSLGLWRDYHSLHRTISGVSPVVDKILSDLQDQKEMFFNYEDTKQTAVDFFDDRTKTLLSLMSQVEHTRLFFWNFPPSWTRRLYNKSIEILTFSDDIYLHSIYLELSRKANLLVHDPVSSNFSAFTSDTDVINPLQTQEFKNLNNYVVELEKLQKYISLYNSLPQTKSVQDLKEIISYLFGFDLPSYMYGKREFDQKSLNKVIENPIKLNDLVGPAQQKIFYLFKRFLFASFEENVHRSSLIDLSKSLNRFETPIAGQPPLKEDLQAMLDQMNSILHFLNNPELSWLNTQSFDPGDLYTQMIGIIYKSSLFGPEIGDQLVLSATAAFNAYKNHLKHIGSNITGPFLEIQNGVLVIGPSLGLVRAQEAFAQFLSMPFMQKADQLEFNLEIPAGTHLYWDSELIDKALDTTNEFNVFLTEKLSTYPLGLQETFRLISMRSAEQKINSLLAQSQNFVDITNFLKEYAAEETLRRQTENLQPNIPTFITLLQALEEVRLDNIYLELRNLLTSQLVQVLSDIDQVFESEGLYEPVSPTFTEWMGEPGAAFSSYNVPDMPSLKAYVDLSQERISYLAVQYAGPILNFLNFSGFHLTSENVTLLTRWTLIYNAVMAYNNKKLGGNSISLLQNFILKEMNTITLENYAQKLSPLSFTHEDFFTDQLQALREGMRTRCEALSGKLALNHYDQIQTFFNNRLAGKFPFVGNNSKAAQGYAQPQDIKEFFELYTTLVESAKDFLKNSKNLGPSRDRALEFLMSMDDVRNFFEPFLTPKNANGLPTYDIDIAFRVNRPHEVGASQLLDWVVQVGPQEIDLHSSSFMASWTYGMPLSISFQWASEAPNQPMPDPKQPHLTVNGTTAAYSYTSPWSLLELLINQESPLTELPNLIDPNPQTLFFEIPTRGSSTPNNPSSLVTKLFVRITPKAPIKQGGQILFVPYFPETAPLLTSVPE